MAVSSGQKIYANDTDGIEGINTINSAVSYSGTVPDAADHIQDYIGNDGVQFCHRPSGQILFQASFSNGMFGGGGLRIVKWVNGGWNETILSRDFGWFTDETVTAYSTGPGKYRFYSSDNWEFAPVPWKIWRGQNNITPGENIICFDSFTVSGNKVNTGELITASLANNQRIGSERGL